MHYIEPFYNWRGYYVASDDSLSPFFNVEYSELQYSNKIYNFYIHPQWDDIGSETLFLKILFVDYDKKTSVIELIGEWNDAIENDIMLLKREVLDSLMSYGINKFILIGEYVYNFHNGDRDYYEEWYEELADNEGWAVMVNLHPAAQYDFLQKKLNRYIELMEITAWRTYKPDDFFQLIDDKISNRLR